MGVTAAENKTTECATDIRNYRKFILGERIKNDLQNSFDIQMFFILVVTNCQTKW